MGLYDFKPQFVPFILSGAKTHTIRAIRKYPSKPGDTLYLYTGLRTKKAKLIRCVDCVKVEEISIIDALRPMGVVRVVTVDGEELDHTEREQLARRDGFSSFHEMMKFWDGRVPFFGHIIHWKRKEKPCSAKR